MVKKIKKFRSNSMSRKRVLIISILIILLVYGVSLLLISVFSMSAPYRVESMPYDFIVKDNIGFNLDSDYMHFGGGPNGATLERSMTLFSDRPAKVSITWEGEGNLNVNKNNFKIAPNVSESITFYLVIPEGLPPGNYSGLVFFRFFDS